MVALKSARTRLTEARRRPVSVGFLYSRREPYSACSGKPQRDRCRDPPLSPCRAAARLVVRSSVGSRPFCGLLRMPAAIADRIESSCSATVDNPVAMGEPHQQTVDERQRDVAQILDHGRFQFGSVRHELDEDLAVQLGESRRWPAAESRPSRDRARPASSVRTWPSSRTTAARLRLELPPATTATERDCRPDHRHCRRWTAARSRSSSASRSATARNSAERVRK